MNTERFLLLTTLLPLVFGTFLSPPQRGLPPPPSPPCCPITRISSLQDQASSCFSKFHILTAADPVQLTPPPSRRPISLTPRTLCCPPPPIRSCPAFLSLSSVSSSSYSSAPYLTLKCQGSLSRLSFTKKVKLLFVMGPQPWAEFKLHSVQF